MTTLLDHDIKQNLANYGPLPKSGLPSVFTTQVVLEHTQAHSFCVLSMTDFARKQQNSVVATETTWPGNPKVFTIWLFTKKSEDP